MNHRFTMLGVIAVAISIPFAAMAASPLAAAPPVEKAAAAQPRVIAVNVLMGAPNKYQGPIRVRGVVSSVFPKEHRLGLLDAIYLNCCSSPCDSLQALPVKWTGTMPALKTLVLVDGEIKRTGEKLEFVATNMETVEQAGGAAK